MAPEPIVLRESLGVSYGRTLLPVPPGAAYLQDVRTGKTYAVQRAPAMGWDAAAEGEVSQILAEFGPGSELQLEPSAGPGSPIEPIRVEIEGRQLVVRSGSLGVRLPPDGVVEPPFPGPIEAVSLDGRQWLGRSSLVGVPWHGSVITRIESHGPCFIQWLTEYRWGGRAGLSFRVRWAAGADTLLVEEEIREDEPCAAVEWLPLAPGRAVAYARGAGEHTGPMTPLSFAALPGSLRGRGRRILGRLSHIAYFNQWNLAWVGFAQEESFVGVFTGKGGSWQRRGAVRIDVVEDDDAGHLLSLPIRRGRRLWGLILSTRAGSGMDSSERRHICNRRKTQLADLAPAKVLSWQLDPPVEFGPSLFRESDLETFRSRLSADPQVQRTLEQYAAAAPERHAGRAAAALWQEDAHAVRQAAAALTDWAVTTLSDIADGGYERLIIFDGRSAKRWGYEFDALRGLGRLSSEDYAASGRTLLALAYMFADPDYCRYEDFWPEFEPAELMAEALRDDMGDCPVPPNFASEFFTTTGLVAELFESHPRSLDWRGWAMDRLDRFMARWFEADGTYHESVNYHTHAFNEILCHIYPLWMKGVRDYFAEPRVRGCLEHFVQMQMPLLSDSIQRMESCVTGHTAFAGWNAARRAPLPADGNSGHEGLEHDSRGELTVAASVYRDTDPVFAGRLMYAWARAGKPLLDGEHPLLTLLTLDPTIPPVEPPWTSVWRRGLGVISKALRPDGAPIWALCRAGLATHHMDFDQGNIHLAAWDSVLLGDHGYHTHDNDGRPIHAAATWLHNTVVYSDDRGHSSGYTGLELAPEPVLVHLADDMDWMVHRIVNTNTRLLDRLSYRVMIPVPATRHVRHTLFVKPDYFLVWDWFEEAHQPSTFWLHPRLPMEPVGEGVFRAGTPGAPHLVVQFVLPRRPKVMESRQIGPLWSFCVLGDTAEPYLALLVPQREERSVRAGLADDGRTVTVWGDGIDDTIVLPKPGSSQKLPVLTRRAR